MFDEAIQMLKRYRYGIALVGLVVMGGALRLWGIDYGLPYQYHPDEPLIVNISLAIGYTRDLNPHWFLHPGLLFYLLCILYGLYFVIGLLIGSFSTTHDFAMAILRDPSLLYLTGRLSSAVFSTATIPLIYFIGRKLYNRRSGLLAATLFTPLYLPVYFGHFIKPEALQTFLTAVAFYFTVGIFQKERLRNYILAGLFTGLAAAAKYPSILIGLSFILAHILKPRKRRWYAALFDHKLVMAYISCFFGFGIGAPFCILEFHNVVKTFLAIKFYMAQQLGTSQTIIWRWLSALRGDIGLIPLILFGMGIVYAALYFNRKNRILLIFPLTHFIIFSLPAWKNVHWQVVTLPFFAILAGGFIDSVFTRIAMPGFIRGGAIILVVIAAMVGPINQVISYDSLLSRTDTRTMAKEWIEEHIPPGAKIAMERARFTSRHSPPLQMSPESIRRNYLNPESGLVTNGYKVWHLKKYYTLLIEATEGITYDIYPILYDPFAGKTPYYERDVVDALGDYRAQGVEYVITTGIEGVLSEKFTEEEKLYIEPYLSFYAELKEKGIFIKEFKPINRRGPYIKIYKLR